MLRTIFLTVFSACTAVADSLPTPEGEVLLTISGATTNGNDQNVARFDIEMLQSLEPTLIETTTIWTEGKQVFEGIALAALVELLGVEGSTLRATAINDYAVDIPLSDAVSGGPIIAYSLNGQEMSIRDKGPLWIIYPYDDEEAYRTEVIYSRSIWQLVKIEAVD